MPYFHSFIFLMLRRCADVKAAHIARHFRYADALSPACRAQRYSRGDMRYMRSVDDDDDSGTDARRGGVAADARAFRRAARLLKMLFSSLFQLRLICARACAILLRGAMPMRRWRGSIFFALLMRHSAMMMMFAHIF